MNIEKIKLIESNIENKDFFLNLALLSKKGNELLYVGMPIADLKVFLSFFREKIDYYFEKGWFCLYVKIFDSICLRINIDFDSQISFIDEITFYNNYLGSYNNISLGCSVKKLIDEYPTNLYADEHFLVLGKDPIVDLIISIDNDENDIWDFNQIYENKITKFKFYISKKDWVLDRGQEMQ